MNNKFNSTFKANLLKTIANKKGNKGFTLIELLVVVIIIGVLAAIALPNLLGQVGKARESEAKSTLGAMNRAQQTVFAEKADFAANIDDLEVPVGNEKFYNITVPGNGHQHANGIDNAKNGTRDYTSGIAYDPLNRIFDTAVCRAGNNATMKAANYVIANTVAPVNAGTSATNDVDVTCPADTEEIQ